MATINLGRIGFVNKGDYNALTAYKVNDIVKYTSGTYACKLAHTGQVPTETTYWQEWVDDNAVHKTGDETIAGTKTFTSTIVGSIDGNAGTVTNGVYTTGNQTIAGVKTFSSSPIVPTPTTGTQAVNKDYADLKVALASFTGGNQNLSTNGYQKLPGGLIVQWGTGSTLSASVNGATTETFTFPVAFPTTCLNALVCGVFGNNSGIAVLNSAPTQTSMVGKLANPWGSTLNGSIRYLAIGY